MFLMHGNNMITVGICEIAGYKRYLPLILTDLILPSHVNG